VQENLCEWVAFGLGFSYDWARQKSLKPIDWHSNADPELNDV